MGAAPDHLAVVVEVAVVVDAIELQEIDDVAASTPPIAMARSVAMMIAQNKLHGRCLDCRKPIYRLEKSPSPRRRSLRWNLHATSRGETRDKLQALHAI